MDRRINDAYLECVQASWKKSISGDMPLDGAEGVLRSEIAESWKRSINYGVSPCSTKDTKLPVGEFERVCRNNSQLIETAYPYLTNLYQYMKGTNYLIQLCDKNGCVLKVISNDELIEKMAAQISTKREGYFVSERIIGTNSSGLCLHLQKPVQVIGEEHFQTRNQKFCCSSAPIFNEKRELLGCLSIMCPKEFYQTYALSVVCTAVDGIEKEMLLKKAYGRLSTLNNLLMRTIESSDSGIIVINANKKILYLNRRTINILKLPAEYTEKQTLEDLIQIGSLPEEFRKLDHNINESEIVLINRDGKRVEVGLCVSVVLDADGNYENSILTLREQRIAYRMANRIAGSRATYTFDSIMGDSKVIKEVKRLGSEASTSNSTVLILGESGTGKELLAQAIHNKSSRADAPFIAINCGSLPRGLIESELFGYERGAFTGANAEGRPGKFELADGGTIFLDEIGDMPLELQASLLRVLQDKEIMRLGGKFSKKIDVRIIAATNKDLLSSIHKNTFREDLYYRLNVLNIVMPPLRERKDDILLLASHFLSVYNQALGRNVDSISNDAKSMLREYSWPGNVRELENTMERLVNLSKSQTITVLDLPREITQGDKLMQNRNLDDGYMQNHEEIPVMQERQAAISPEFQEYQRLDNLLKQEKGHVKSVAALMDMPLSTLYGKLKKYNLDPKQYRHW